MENEYEDRPELTGSLVSIEFGPGGRMQQLWAQDPSLPEEGEDFQFILPPIQFGEESADDYYPGTILLGARTSPEESWIVSRNTQALFLSGFESENYDPSSVSYEYQFPFWEDIRATGKFYEVATPLSHICWDVEIRNAGRQSIEIGELGFPMAFNNYYDGFLWTDEQLGRLWNSRLYLHKYIGGASSWLFAQRMTAQSPGLLVFPGDDTSWEFFAHVPSSLTSPYQWEGIPVLYAHSKATMERELWPQWFNEHTSLILEPGDSRKFQMKLAPIESDKLDGVHAALAMFGKPTIKLLPSAVVPVDQGVSVEIQGHAPKKFYISRNAEVTTDFDEGNAFCFIQTTEPGPMTVSFRDKDERMCHAHLMFTEPIANLIQKRAKYIAENQVVDDPNEVIHKAIVLTNVDTGAKATDPEDFLDASGIESSLADALFLAEKNGIYPVKEEIQVLNGYVKDFLLTNLQNPGNFAVASAIEESTQTAGYFGRPLSYPHVFNLYHSLYRIATTYGGTEFSGKEYLLFAFHTAIAMFEQGWRLYVRTVGILGYARLFDLVDDLRRADLTREADELHRHLVLKAQDLMKMKYPYAGETVLDTSGFEEVFAAAKFMSDDDHLERTVRCAFAARSLAPSWWWYGSDKRSWDGGESSSAKALMDRGEACLSHTTIPNSLIFFGMMDRDYQSLPEAYMRMAFGGMVGPWALVRPDGGVSMCFCPDQSSKHSGYNPYTGSSGLGYYHYMRHVASFVLPSREMGMVTFGCRLEQVNETYVLHPWDGVGRRFVLRQIGVEIEFGFGCTQVLRLDQRKRWFEADILNPTDKDIEATIKVSGLWGKVIDLAGVSTKSDRGVARGKVLLPAGVVTTVKGKVIS